MAPKLPYEKYAQIRKLLQEGLNHIQIAAATGSSLGTINNIKLGKLTPDKLFYQGPGIRTNKNGGTTNWRDLADEAARFQDVRSYFKKTQDHAVIELGDGNHDVALAGFSDQHIGSWGTNYRLLKEMTDELLGTKNLFIGLVGDYGQYAIRLRNVLEISDNLLPPEMQTDFIQSWFDEIWHKVAFATWDNHGVERQEATSGESSVKRILSRKVVYFNGIGHIDIKVGNQLYKGAVSHRFRGQSFLNPVHSQMRYLRMEGNDREFALAGDTHVPAMMQYPDGELTRVAVNLGSLQLNSGYAKRYFSLTTHPVYPIIVFSHDEHLMTPFYSIKAWLKCTGGKKTEMKRTIRTADSK